VPHISTLQAPIRILNQYTGKTVHHVRNSFHFIRTQESLKIKPGDLMVSFDVVSLFTKVPVENSLTLLSQHFNDILALYKHLLKFTYFCVDGQFHEQAPERSRKSVATAKPAAPKAQRACPSAEQKNLGEVWNHVVRRGVSSRLRRTNPTTQTLIPILIRLRRHPQRPQ